MTDDHPADYDDLQRPVHQLHAEALARAQQHRRAWSTSSAHIMREHGVAGRRSSGPIDHDIATGVWPDMREHGWATDDWPAIFEKVLAADILVLAGPIWLGDNSSVMKQVHERLYGGSHLLNDAGQYLYYGRVGGCLITGNEDGIKHCAHERPLHAAAHRLHDPAAGRRRLDRRGRARARPTSTRDRAVRRTTSPTATPPS